MFHSSFAHLSVEGYLGCFQFGAIMNNAAITFAYRVFFVCFLWFF